MNRKIYPRNHNKLHWYRNLHSKGQFQKYSLHIKAVH